MTVIKMIFKGDKKENKGRWMNESLFPGDGKNQLTIHPVNKKGENVSMTPGKTFLQLLHHQLLPFSRFAFL